MEETGPGKRLGQPPHPSTLPSPHLDTDRPPHIHAPAHLPTHTPTHPHPLLPSAAPAHQLPGGRIQQVDGVKRHAAKILRDVAAAQRAQRAQQRGRAGSTGWGGEGAAINQGLGRGGAAATVSSGCRITEPFLVGLCCTAEGPHAPAALCMQPSAQDSQRQLHNRLSSPYPSVRRKRTIWAFLPLSHPAS